LKKRPVAAFFFVVADRRGAASRATRPTGVPTLLNP
jgi:hypothetical protein